MIELAKKAALEGGAILKEAFGTVRQQQIDVKGQGDYVTELDRRSEEVIMAMIRGQYPNHSIMAEESGGRLDETTVTWIVDPLDGTANFIFGIPVFAVSIGVLKGGELVAGVVYNPATESMYAAEKGGGAWLGGEKLSVSANDRLNEAVLATAFPWRHRQHMPAFMAGFQEIMAQTADLRRMGAAAMDLAMTAAGVVDGFYEMKLKAWDVAAGALLVKEAGGLVTDFNGEAHFLENGSVIAASPLAHGCVLSSMKGRFEDLSS